MVVTLLALAVSDVAQRRVANEVVLWALCAALMSAGLRSGAEGAQDALSAGALVAGVLLPSYALGLMGAADVKAGFAVGVAVGSAHLYPLFCATVLATFVGSCAILFPVACTTMVRAGRDFRWADGVHQERWSLGKSLPLARRRNTTLPFATCLSFGALYAGQGGNLWRF